MVLGIAINIAINPEFDLTSAIVGGVVITILPIGLGIYCVRRGRKSPVAVVPPVPVPPVSQRGWVRPCDYKNFLDFRCEERRDLAQCPECDGWFCKKHDKHECFPVKLDAQVRKQIDVARSRRGYARSILVSGLGGVPSLMYGFYLLYMWWVVLVMVIWGAIMLHSFIVYLHYSRRLRQLGVRKRSIRPQTAKKDR